MEWSAKARYNWHRRKGLSTEAALDAVAIDFGLAAQVVRLTGKDPEELVPLHWTLKQMNYIFVLRWSAEHGLIGGPDH